MGLLEEEILCNYTGKTESRPICRTMRGDIVVPICPMGKGSPINENVKSIVELLRETETSLTPLALKGMELTDEEFRLIVDAGKKVDRIITTMLENSRPTQS